MEARLPLPVETPIVELLQAFRVTINQHSRSRNHPPFKLVPGINPTEGTVVQLIQSLIPCDNIDLNYATIKKKPKQERVQTPSSIISR